MTIEEGLKIASMALDAIARLLVTLSTATTATDLSALSIPESTWDLLKAMGGSKDALDALAKDAMAQEKKET